MIIAWVIIYMSIIAWLFPAIKQYRGNYGYYFLILSATDPLSLAAVKLHLFNPHVTFLLSSTALIFAVGAKDKRIKMRFLLPALFIAFIAGLSLPRLYSELIITAEHVVILFYIIRSSIIFAGSRRYLSFFHLLLIIYESSLILKMLYFTLDPQKGIAYFYFTSAFGVLLGILFSVFTEEDKRFAIKLKKQAAYRTIIPHH